MWNTIKNLEPIIHVESYAKCGTKALDVSEKTAWRLIQKMNGEKITLSSNRVRQKTNLPVTMQSLKLTRILEVRQNLYCFQKGG